MVNCNPETVSTDYDTSGRLYFEPLTLEDVLEVVAAEQAAGPVAGVIVQLGGQTPLGLARGLADAGLPIPGTSPDALHLAAEPGRLGGLPAPAGPPTPPRGRPDIERVRASTEAIARGVGVRGLLNVQYALAAGVMYVLEANPRASRTVPFVSKATAVPLAKAAARIMLGATIARLRAEGVLPPSGDGGTLPLDAPIAVKEAVLPFNRFRDAAGRGVDTVLGPEMRSAGEGMGIDEAFGTAYAKSQAAPYGSLPVKGRVFVAVANTDQRAMVFPVERRPHLAFGVSS